MAIKPLEDRVLVKPDEAEEKTSGGIILPETAKKKPHEGTIIAVGPGKINKNGIKITMEVKVGDKILYGKYSGAKVIIDGTEHLIMKESDILAVLN